MPGGYMHTLGSLVEKAASSRSLGATGRRNQLQQSVLAMMSPCRAARIDVRHAQNYSGCGPHQGRFAGESLSG